MVGVVLFQNKAWKEKRTVLFSLHSCFVEFGGWKDIADPSRWSSVSLVTLNWEMLENIVGL